MKVQKEQSILFESVIAELTDVELAKVLGGQNASQSRCNDEGDYSGTGNESFSDANTNNFNLPLNLNLL